MLNEQKIKNINERIKGNKSSVPNSLFKYRPFDEFTYDMLENEYLYLCPAKRLDDPSECSVSIDLQDYYDAHTNQLTKRCVRQIIESIRPYTSSENFQQVLMIIDGIMTSNGLIKRNWLLDASFELQNLVPTIEIAPLINMLGNIPESINEPNIRNQIEQLLLRAVKAREDFGICSLTIDGNNRDMWGNYTNESAGYCIEYDISHYKFTDMIFHVVYSSQRENNVLMNIICDFIGQMVIGISNGQIDADRSKYLRMFLTKDEKWQYQKEWRIIGDAGQKLEAPPIKAIYLGDNVQTVDAIKMESFCDKKRIILEKCCRG